MLRYLFLLAGLGLFLVPSVALGATVNTNEIRVLKMDGGILRSFIPFPGTEQAIGSLTVGDLGHDGVSEIVVGAGRGNKPLVRLFRQDGSQIHEFLAYGEGFTGGVNVALCDLDDDGSSEIITGAGFSGGPQVRVFSSDGTPTGQQFFAYSEAFRGGVNVACGDIDGDGTPEIVTGAGVSGGPHVRVFTANGSLKDEAFSGSANDNTGAFVSLGDLSGDGVKDVLTSPAAFAVPNVTVFSFKNFKLSFVSSLPASATATYGAPVTAANIDGGNDTEILVTSGAFSAGVAKAYKAVGTLAASVPLGDNTTGSWAIAGIPEQPGVFVSASVATPLSPSPETQLIHVDISEQRLTAYQNGVPVNTFLVSTGLPGWNTPQGRTTITDKIPIKDYGWNFGPGNPGNYFLPNVKYNLRFRPMFYIHSAYWHNNFGKQMSHGCVNVSVPNAEWIYNWAAVGATVEIVP